MEKKKLLNKILLMYCVIPIYIFGFYSIFKIFTDQSISYWWVYSIIGYICMMMLGIAGCYHRMLSHKGYSTNRFIKIIMLWFATIAGQGSAVFWVGIHRGYHHRNTDTDNDPHSPIHGFWHSYIFWMFNFDYSKINLRFIIDIIKDNDCMFFHKHYAKIFFGSHLFLLIINFDLWLFLFALPAFLTLHANGLNTSLNHYKFMGYTNYNLKDNSVNSIWLFPFIQGEAWHNNHHGDPRNINYGIKFWELDPTYWLIRLIKSNRSDTG